MNADTRKLLIYYFKNLCGHLLNKYGEFFPVAAGINKKGDIVPLHVYFGEEHPTSQKVIAEFELTFKKLLIEEEFVTFAICLDVIVTVPHHPGKIDSLEIRCQNMDKVGFNIYLPYKRSEGNLLIFLEAYEKRGSLNIF